MTKEEFSFVLGLLLGAGVSGLMSTVVMLLSLLW